MMSCMPLETCSAFNQFWINKFYYKVASCWLFLLIHTTMHGSMNIKFINLLLFCFPYLNHLQPKDSSYMEPLQGLNLNRRSISRLELEMPVIRFSVCCVSGNVIRVYPYTHCVQTVKTREL